MQVMQSTIHKIGLCLLYPIELWFELWDEMGGGWGWLGRAWLVYAPLLFLGLLSIPFLLMAGVIHA